MLIGEIVKYCSDPALGRLLSIIRRVFAMVEILAPILLMIGIAVPLFKLITTDPEDKKIKKHISNAVTAAVVVMLLPAIVNLVMYVVDFATDSKFVVSECWSDAKVLEGDAQYVPYNDKRQKFIFLINPDDYANKGVSTDPNYRADRVPEEDPDEEYDEGGIYGDIVWDPNNVTKISNLNSAQLIKILNAHSKKAQNFIPYAQALINAERKYHVNVFFLIAIDAWESGWMTSSISKACNNLGGVTESAAHPSNGCGSNARHRFAYFSSVGEYIKYHANLLHTNYLSKGGHYYHGKSVKAVQTDYCPLSDGCTTWVAGITSIANSLFAKAKKLNIATSSKAEKIAKTAENLSWPEGTSKSKYSRFNGGGGTKAFMEAYRRIYPNYKNSSDKSVAAGTCCCHFARTCVAEALGKKIRFSLLPDSSRDEYTKEHMAKLGFTRIKFDGKVSSLKRGDVLYYRASSYGHAWIYLGNKKAAEASHTAGYGGRITSVSSGGKLKVSNKNVYYIFRAI